MPNTAKRSPDSILPNLPVLIKTYGNNLAKSTICDYVEGWFHHEICQTQVQAFCDNSFKNEWYWQHNATPPPNPIFCQSVYWLLLSFRALKNILTKCGAIWNNVLIIIMCFVQSWSAFFLMLISPITKKEVWRICVDHIQVLDVENYWNVTRCLKSYAMFGRSSVDVDIYWRRSHQKTTVSFSGTWGERVLTQRPAFGWSRSGELSTLSLSARSTGVS